MLLFALAAAIVVLLAPSEFTSIAHAQTPTGNSYETGTWVVTYVSSGAASGHAMSSTVQNPTAFSYPWTDSASEPAGGGSFGGGPATDATTSGTVTATATWHPGTGQTMQTDPPPAVNILTQSATASATGGIGPYVHSNGLGSNVTDTTYKIVDGTSGTITATDTLSASTGAQTTVPIVAGGAGAVASFGIAVTPETVTLTDPAAPPGSHKALTGDPLIAGFSGGPGIVQSYTWSLQNSADDFKTWRGTVNDGTQKLQLTSADLSGTNPTPSDSTYKVSSLTYYTAKAATDSANCSVVIKMPDGTSQTVNPKSLPIAILKPTAQWGIKEGECQKVSQTLVGLFRETSDPLNYNGETWHDVNVMVPSPFSNGTFAFGQIITPSMVDTIKLGSGSTGPAQYHLPNNGSPGLDNVFPLNANQASGAYDVPGSRPPGFVVDGDSPAIDWSNAPEGVTLNTGDSLVQDAADESFVTYLFYKSPAAGSIYVPLQRYSWSWAGTWALESPYPNDTPGWTEHLISPLTGSVRTADPTDTYPSWTIVHSASDKMVGF